MKTLNKLKLQLLMSLVINGLALAAGTVPPTNTPTATPTKTTSTAPEKTIHDYIRFPQVLFPKTELKTIQNKVEVVFTTGDNGKVNFVLAKTEDALLKKEIEKQFTNLVLPQLKKDVAYSVVLRFKTV